MNKYIEAEELKTFMRTMLTGNDLYTPNGIDEFVDGLPAADVVKRVHRGRRPSDDLVKVVRCKDCKHRYVGGYTTLYYVCDFMDAELKDEGYCSYGERKDE